jgi:uncharacterized membrane protein (Fun14 family)
MDQIQKPKSQAVAVPTDNRQLTTDSFLVWIAWSIALAVLILRHAAGGADRVYAFNDYMLAGSHWLRGEYLYGNWRGFIYSPGIAAFFVPLALLPSVISYGLWLLLNVAVFLGGFAALLKSNIVPGLDHRSIALCYLLLLFCAVGNLDVGQANPFVAGLLMFAIAAVTRDSWNIAALCIALAAYFKIYPFALGMLICVIAPRRFIGRLLLALLVLAVAPYLFQHWSYVTSQYQAWIATRVSDQRLNYSLKYAPIDLWFLIRTIAHLPIPAWAYTLIQLGTGGLIALFTIWGLRKNWSIQRLLCGQFFLVTIWMTLCGPATEAHTYLLMAPALVIALVKSFRDRQPLLFRTTIFAAAFFQAVHMSRFDHFLHNKHTWVFIPQPLSALLFLAYCILWLPGKASASCQLSVASCR